MTRRALDGWRVLITRPADQAADLAAAISNAGGDAIRFPVMEIVGREADVIAIEFEALPAPDIIIFVSSNAVRYGGEIVTGHNADVAAIGPATLAALKDRGTAIDILPAENFDSEGLLAHPSLINVKDKNITIVRGERGREKLGDELTGRSAQVNYLSTYRRQIRRPSGDEINALTDEWQRGGIDAVVVMSVETLDFLLELLPRALLKALKQALLVAPGARVIQTAMKRLPGLRTADASGPETNDILTALIESRHPGR